MRNPTTLTIIAACLLLCATLIFVYSAYADPHPLKADARVWKVRNKETCKASVNAPHYDCFGFYSMTVEAVHAQNDHDSGDFSGSINHSITTSGPASDDNYAGAYISDHNINDPHYSESASKTAYGDG